MFTDSARFQILAGKGGNGVVSWRREKYIPKGGPAGGNGGNGGEVRVRVSHHHLSLEHFRHTKIVKAENGVAGGPNLCQGRRGKDLVLEVPAGTLIKNPHTGEIILDCTQKGEEWVLCRGGRGGRGNASFKSPTHQAPVEWTPGQEGETIEVELELKLIADVGLVGMPNAGKSTLISRITYVPVKIAPYPFTTLTPNLGAIRFDDFSQILIADIPGIIERAHENKGLGLSFLKHIERTSVLLYVIDISGFECRDPLEDFATLQNELKNYSPELLKRPTLVALNKIDIEGAEEHLAAFRAAHPELTIFPISAAEGKGLAELLAAMRRLAQQDGKRY